MIFSSIFLLFKKYKKENYDLNPNSKETFILVNNWFMMFYLITVLLGTIYPIFTDVLQQTKFQSDHLFTTSYNSHCSNFSFIMAIGPKVKWIKEKFENLKIIYYFIGSILINFLIIFLFKSYSILSNLIIISALFDYIIFT